MRRALDSASLFPLLFGRNCIFQLDVGPDANGEVPEYKFIHVASTGLYKGHWQGEFDLTPAVFASFVRNLRSHPQYTLGDVPVDGKTVRAGSKPTIQFDYEHASEMPPTEGDIPNRGTEAPAWVLDLDVRPDETDAGGQKLYALAWLGDQIRDQIKRNAYRQTSIAFDLDARDWRTGEPCGPALTSIAFTNKPFLKQLESYAAANRGVYPRRRAATDPPGGAEPPPAPTPEPERTPMTTPATPPAIDWQQIHVSFKANICRRLGTRVLAEDQAVEEAVGEAAADSSTLSKLLTALGVTDGTNAMKAVEQLLSARDQLAGALSELDEMLSGQAAMEQTVENADIGAVMSALKYPDKPEHRAPLVSFRKQCIEEEVATFTSSWRRRLNDDKARVPVTKVLSARKDGRDKFLKTYGLAADGVDRSMLLTNVAAARGGKQLPVAATPGLPIDDPTRDNHGGKEQVDVRACAGRNPIEKVITHLSAKDPSFAKLSHFERVKQASAFATTHEIIAA